MTEEYFANGIGSGTCWVLDTETTGFNPDSGDRLIEVGAIEMYNRKPTGRRFHEYVDPEMEVPEQAVTVHGWRREDLIAAGKGQRFIHIAERLFNTLKGTTLIIHNAPFDMGFLDFELSRAGLPKLSGHVKVFDTLKYANNLYPGKRNNLDALCRRLGVNNGHRELHGALLDSEILSEVFLLMTQEQNTLHFNKAAPAPVVDLSFEFKAVQFPGMEKLKVITALDSEIENHNKIMKRIDKESGGNNLWPSM